MFLTTAQIRQSLPAVLAASVLLLSASAALAQSRVGDTQIPIEGLVRFPAVAYDETNDVYLVTHGFGAVSARFVSASGAPLGSPVTVNTGSPGASRVACGASPSPCLIAWVQEPSTIMGRLVRYSSGSVALLTAPFVINSNGIHKWPEFAPAIAFSPVSGGEFFVAWTESNLSLKGQRVSVSGAAVGPEVAVATSFPLQFLPSATYNSARDEYVIAFQAESGNTGIIAAQRIKPRTGAILGSPVTLYTALNEKYPEIAYNSVDNQFLVISWHEASSGWLIHGRLADEELRPLGSLLTIASHAGGVGIGLAHNPFSNTYFGIHQNPFNDQIQGVSINKGGSAGNQILVMAYTASQPSSRVAASTKAGRFLVVSSMEFRAVMSQLVQGGSGGGGGSGPGAPTPTSPSGIISGSTPSFTWQAVSGAAQYQLWVTDSTGAARVQRWFTAAEVGCGAGTGACTASPNVSLATGSGKWWVQAWNSGGYSPWSNGLAFSVAQGAPSAISPAGTVAGSPILFNWSSVPGASMYYLWINDRTGPKFQGWVNASAAGCASGGTCGVNVAAELLPGNGIWWVEAWGQSIGYSPWSNGRTFTIAEVAAPTLFAPAGQINGSPIEFTWELVSGASHYYLWVTDGSGTRKIGEWFTAAQACSTGAVCVASKSINLTSGNGVWWVQAWSPTGLYSPWSVGKGFFVP